jgi:hypothetical protein
LDVYASAESTDIARVLPAKMSCKKVAQIAA